MFLKKHLRKKNGKCHTYWELVRSFRIAKGSRHQRVAYLGELTEEDCGGWAALVRQLDGKPPGVVQPTLFDPEPEIEPEPVPEIVTVKVNGVCVEATKDFGDVWLGLTLWRTLRLDRLFAEILPEGREDVAWHVMTAILAIARLCEPSSELHIQQTWYPRTALPEILGVKPEQVYGQRLYRTLDVLTGCKQAVEKHLKNQLGELFSLDYDLLLYDITSTYFEGEAADNPQAKRGYSRDKRSDCKQVCIALIVTTDGMPHSYEVFDGNRADVTTVPEMVESVEGKYGKARRVWVLDRGMVNEENLKFIRDRDGYYIVGTPRSQLKKYERELTESGWRSVYEDIEVKLCPSPDGAETFVLCRSQSRAEKEQAMRQQFSRRIQDALEKLAKRLSTAKKRPDRSRVERQIGRFLQKNSRAAGKFDIKVTDDPDRSGHLKLFWSIREEWSQWARLSQGAYMLRTNLNGRTPEELWHTYIQLTDAEEAFRTMKSELNLRPIFHQIQPRVHAHILVAFVAYAMWKTLQKWMENCGLGRGVRTVLQEFARLKCCEVILPTTSGRDIRLCCVSKPDTSQRVLLKRLGIEIPSRLGDPKWRQTIENGPGM